MLCSKELECGLLIHKVTVCRIGMGSVGWYLELAVFAYLNNNSCVVHSGIPATNI